MDIDCILLLFTFRLKLSPVVSKGNVNDIIVSPNINRIYTDFIRFDSKTRTDFSEDSKTILAIEICRFLDVFNV